jgi:hypothetical protein
MKDFLLLYNTKNGNLEVQEFEEGRRQEALEARFAAEVANRERPYIEVVLLGADSLEAVKTTHSRYFMQTLARGAVGF